MITLKHLKNKLLERMQDPPTKNNYMLAWSINNTEIDSWRKMHYLNDKEVKRLKEYNNTLYNDFYCKRSEE